MLLIMLRALLVFLLLAPASTLYWLEDTNATSASALMSTGNWAHSPIFSINYGTQDFGNITGKVYYYDGDLCNVPAVDLLRMEGRVVAIRLDKLDMTPCPHMNVGLVLLVDHRQQLELSWSFIGLLQPR